MKHFNWTRIAMYLVFSAAFTQAFGQSDNYTFEANNPGDILATHDEWENDNLLYANGFQAIWGTTIEFSPKNTVYLQSFVPSGGAYTQQWDGMYYSPNYAPFLTFHGMADDGGQVVVAASQEFDNQITSFPYVFSVDISSGAVLWANPLFTGDAVQVNDMQIIQDFSGEFVVAVSFQSLAPFLSTPNAWSGLAIMKFDPSGNLLFFETIREQSNVPELFRLTDLEQSTITGNYIAVGAYSGNGPQEEVFIVEFDQGSGNALGAPLNLYDWTPGPEEHISITDDGNEYYVSYYAFSQVLGLAVLDGGLNNFTNLVYPPFPGKNNVYSNDINFDPGTGQIELMVSMQDFGGVFSSGIGQITPGGGPFNAREFDYAPGFKEAFPVGYAPLQPSFVPAASYMFLAHPTFGASGILPFPANNNYLRILDTSPNSCIPPNSFQVNAFAFPPNQGAQGMVPDNQFQFLPDQPIQDVYDGIVYDCLLNPSAPYRKADPSTEIEISLLPNPVISNLQLEGDLSSFEQIELFDVTGRLIKTEAIRSKLNVSNLSPGVYHLVLSGDSSRETLKFVKQ